MTFLEAIERYATSALFRPPLDVDAVLVAAATARLYGWCDRWGGFREAGLPLWAHAEACPRCDAQPGELCHERRRPVEAHRGREEVAGLRLARLWVPRTGEPVIFATYGAWGEVPESRTFVAWFVRWEPNGDAVIEADWPTGGKTAQKRGEAPGKKRGRRVVEPFCLWPVS